VKGAKAAGRSSNVKKTRIADEKTEKAAKEKADRDANSWENRKPGRKDEEDGYQGKGKGRAMN
jgi:hypothetical protein